MYMSAVESEQAQRRGVISIHWTLGSEVIAVRHNPIRKAMPMHFAGFHVCYSEAPLLNAATTILYGMNASTRARFRSHSGNHIECVYSLQGYGIPHSALPISGNGELLTSHHIFWVERRQSAERIKNLAQKSMVVDNVSIPNHAVAANGRLEKQGAMKEGGLRSAIGVKIVGVMDNDVLLTRGRPKADHAGSSHFRNFVDDSMPQFEKATKSERVALAEATIRTIKASGGRFLKRESEQGKWENIGYGALARKRVLMAYRNRRKALASAGKGKSPISVVDD